MTQFVLESAHVDVLRNSTCSTFGVFCGIEPTFEGTFESVDYASSVQGIIAVVGDLSWSVTIGFPPKTATDLAEKVAGFEIPFESDDMTDIIGELANVLAGDIVARLDGLGVDVKMSLPSVARGERFRMVHPGASSAARMMFRLPQGPMWLELAVAKKAA
jgi:chemotaxis protein CheX